MSSSDLLALQIRLLHKKNKNIAKAAETLKRARIHLKEVFERRFIRWLKKDSYQPGELVLIRNTGVEKDLDRKTKPRYLGPYEVVRRTRNGTCVLRKLDGAVSAQSVTGFRPIPYISRDDR